jgi:hypothetical protein
MSFTSVPFEDIEAMWRVISDCRQGKHVKDQTADVKQN